MTYGSRFTRLPTLPWTGEAHHVVQGLTFRTHVERSSSGDGYPVEGWTERNREEPNKIVAGLAHHLSTLSECAALAEENAVSPDEAAVW